MRKSREIYIEERYGKFLNFNLLVNIHRTRDVSFLSTKQQFQSVGCVSRRRTVMDAKETCKVSCSRWLSSHNNAHQSQWLQTTLSDLDEKTKAILALMQDEGESFAQRAEMYYKKRPELIQMVEELQRSYRALAERYDLLRSESTHITNSSSSNSFKHILNLARSESPDSQSIVEDPDCNMSEMIYLDKMNDELLSTEPTKKDSLTKDENIDYQKADNVVGNFADDSPEERKNVWSNLRLQVAKLMEDNLRQQVELVKRNDEKREAIKDLVSQLDKVVDENQTLQDCLRCSKVGMKQNQSQMSKLKALILGKIFGGTSS